MMKNLRIRGMTVLGIVIASLLFDACSTVPVTGRRQLSLISSSDMLAMSTQEYDTFLKSHKIISASDGRAIMVKTVGRRIQSAVEQYFRQNNLSLDGYAWEFNLVENSEKNAWCMPGGKVMVYTGILPLTQQTIRDSHDARYLVVKSYSGQDKQAKRSGFSGYRGVEQNLKQAKND